MTTRALAAVGGLAAILTIVGLSGVGDAPAPLDEAHLMAEHFQAVRVDVFIGAAVGLVGRESELLRFTAKWSVAFLLVICVITYLQAYYLTWMIP